MKWKKDDELFADIDEKGRLFEDEFTQRVLKGKASESIDTEFTFSYNESGKSKSKSDEIVESCLHELEGIRKYVAGHSHIGAFPQTHISTVTVDTYEEKIRYGANPDYNPELAARQQRISEIEDQARQDAWLVQDTIGYGRDNDAVGFAIDHEIEKIHRAADDARDSLNERALQRDEGTSTCATVAVGSQRILKNSSKYTFNFFDEMDSLWDGLTEIASVELNERTNWSLFMKTLRRIPVWLVLLGSILLVDNLAWQFENPISALLGLSEPDAAFAGMMAVAAVMLLFLTFSSASTAPVPAVAYPLLFGTYSSIILDQAETIGLKEGLCMNIAGCAVFGTGIILIIYACFKFGLKGGAIAFAYAGLSSAVVMELCTEPKFTIYGALLLFAVTTIVNLVNAFQVFRSGGDWKEELFDQVNEHALTEYKMLRFIWLWINNTGLPGAEKEKYFAIVDEKEKKLKEKVAEAEAYAKARHLEFKQV